MSNSKARILIIDYEPRSIEQLRGPLETAGFQIEVAKDGLVGIETFQSWQPDLTLIEAMLPKRHGFEVCQELKKTPHGTKTPIVIVTSVYKGRKYRTQAIHNYHCDEYLEKPIDADRLLQTVNQLLEGRILAVDVEEEVSNPAGDLIVEELSDPLERDIMDRLDSILPGGGPQPTVRAVPEAAPIEAPPSVARAPDTRTAEAAPPAAGSKGFPAPAMPTRRDASFNRAAVPQARKTLQPPPRPTGRQAAQASDSKVSEGFWKWVGFLALGLVILVLALIVAVS